eukprot:10298272-Lingulodinium_polyedra.AAC.1
MPSAPRAPRRAMPRGSAPQWRPCLARRGCAPWRAARPAGAIAGSTGSSGGQRQGLLMMRGSCAHPGPSTA